MKKYIIIIIFKIGNEFGCTYTNINVIGNLFDNRRFYFEDRLN
jgi:hypothetical protein